MPVFLQSSNRYNFFSNSKPTNSRCGQFHIQSCRQTNFITITIIVASGFTVHLATNSFVNFRFLNENIQNSFHKTVEAWKKLHALKIITGVFI